MKKTLLILPLIFTFIFYTLVDSQPYNKINIDTSNSNIDIRTKLNFNREWKFAIGDSIGAESTSYNDANWSRVGLPHSASLPYFMWSKVYNGIVWYRKQFDVPASWNGKNIIIEFEGVFIQTEVFINGVSVGKHVGGYTGFNFDITNYITTGTNVIAVKVDNLWNARVAPRAGDHQFSAGIYRDVYLTATDKLHVDWCGTFITTPTVSKTSAICKAQTEVKNDYTEDKTCTVKTEIVDPDGTIISTVESTDVVPQNKVKVFSQTLPAITNPKLWNTTTPYLHRAITTISYNGAVVDSYETSFGIRWFTWTSDQGFFLNGDHLFLLGANVHQDHAGWGDGVTNAAIKRDVQMIKDAGFNCIRGSHYPHDPAFSQACDELGMIFFSENAFWGMGGGSGDRNGWGTPSSSCYPPVAADQPYFDQSVLGQLKEAIKVHRNRASIAAWSMCNEPFFTDASTLTAMKKLLNTATDSARIWDMSRSVAIGGAQRQGIDTLRKSLGKGTIAFYNGDGASLYPNPGVPNLVSEYGSTTAYRPGSFISGWRDLSDGWVRPVWRSGQVIWCGFDHGTVGGESLAIMGLIDYFRIPKRQYYWYQQAYAQGVTSPVAPTWPASGTPAKLKLESRSNTISAPDGTDDVHLVVTVLDANGTHISNNVPVKLEILSGPGEFPTGTFILFVAPSTSQASDISIRDGQAAIEFRSYWAGTSVIQATSPGLVPDTFTVTTQGTPLWVEGVTPKTIDRPYFRYGQSQVPATVSEMLLATNRPVLVSSTLVGTSKINVNDDNSTTIWQPDASDTQRWCELQLEASYCLNRIQLEFPAVGAYRYIIEVSSDEVNWTKVIDQSQSSINDKIRIAYGNLGRNVSSVRITFTSTIAGLAEVKIGGAPILPEKSNLLTGTIIGTSGSWNNVSTTTKEAAFDFDTATYFDGPSGGSPFWVGLDLGYGAQYTVNKIIFTPRAGLESRMLNGKFEGATTSTFTDKSTIYTISTSPLAAANTATVSNGLYSRYVRYLSTDAGNGNVAELELYGVSKITGIAELKNIQTSSNIYYNKTAKMLKVTFSSLGNNPEYIKISGIDGRVVKIFSVKGVENYFSIDLIPSGVYLVSISYANYSENRKLIIY